tara:strand:- start:90 stop:419 length:330 start_codon:yes stop_codon:yes gene_type:complete
MSRYRHNKAKKLTNVHTNNAHYNQLGYNSTIYPKITREPSDPVIIASSVDRLDLLADRFYEDRTLWWLIAVANELPGDTFFVTPGTQLFIPKNLSKIMRNMTKANRFGE